MEIKIDNLYGIKNKIEFEFAGSAVIFAPNGTGKTSLTKGFKASENKRLGENLEGNVVSLGSLKIDGKNMLDYDGIKVFDSNNINDILNDPLGIIRGFLNYKNEYNEISNKYLPNKIKADYQIEYKNITDKLEKDNIDFKKIQIENNNFDGIDDINNVIKNTKKLSDKELLNEYDNYKTLKELLNKLEESDVTDYNVLLKKTKDLTKNKYDDNILKDFSIMQSIKNKNRDDIFGYKINSQFKTIKDVYEEIKTKANENGISKLHLIAASAIVHVDKIRGSKRVTKTANAQINFLKETIIKCGQIIHDQEIIKNESDFEKIGEVLKKNKTLFLDEYNSYVEKLNKEILNINDLKWKIKINKISDYYEKTSIKIIDNGVERDQQALIEFASEGQRRIIAIILASISTLTSKLIIFDDIVSSLDSDNIDIFKGILKRIVEDEIKNFILLTHNYTLVANIGNIQKLKFFGLETIENETINFPFDGQNALILHNLFQLNTNNMCDKTLFSSTVLRETIDNYIEAGYPKEYKNQEKDIKSKLLLFKSDLEKLYRHYKVEEYTFRYAAEYIENNHKEAIEIFSDTLIKSLIENKSEKIIANHVIEFKPKPQFKNLLDYITQKYIYALKVRFLFEKKTYEVLSEEFKNNWDNNKIFGMLSDNEVQKCINPEKINIFAKMFSHNHLNNLRWTPIVETPMSKIKMYLDIIDDDDYLIEKIKK